MRKVIVALALMAGIATVAPAPHADAAVTIRGVVRTLAADTVEHATQDAAGHAEQTGHTGHTGHTEQGGREFTGHSADVYRQVLVVGDKGYFLKGPRVRPNTEVLATGTVSGNTLTATTITPTATVSGITTSGSTNVLVMLAYWTAPDSVTPTSATNQLFSDTNGWYQDASYGALGQTGTVTPWMQIAGPTSGCYADHLTLMSQAKAAATNLGYNVNSYSNYILYFPYCAGDSAGYAGWAYVGSTGTWLNGYLDRRVTVHEQGHNYGLWHSHSNMCTLGGVSGTCSFLDYGDQYDAMGSSGYVGHFNASQKSLLGWIGAGSRLVDLSSGGTATLVPMADNTSATHAAKVVVAGGRTYWLEYRQPIDYDSGLPTSGTDGVIVHVSGSGTGSTDSGASIIDVRPSDGIAVTTSTLQAGGSWTSPEGLTFSVGTVNASGATVTVTLPPSVPTVTGSSPANGATAVAIGTNASRTAMTATFSENVTGVDSSSFTLTQAGGSAVSASVTYDAATRTATLLPDAALTADTTYTLALGAAIKNGGGSSIAPQSWSFLTGPRPTVTGRFPAVNATGVSRTGNVTATFSEAITGLPTAWLSSANFTLRGKGNALISSTVQYDAATRTVTLDPTTTLSTKTKYTVTLSSSITDLAGNALVSVSWSFTTGNV